MAGFDESFHCTLDRAAIVKRGFQKIHVKMHRECLQVQILFTPEVSDGKRLNVIHVIGVG